MVLTVVAACIMSVGVAVPASALSCDGTAQKAATWTLAHAGTCSAAQARIDRFSGSAVYSHYGSQAKTSFVEATYGQNAGNYYRILHNGQWYGWQWVS